MSKVPLSVLFEVTIVDAPDPTPGVSARPHPARCDDDGDAVLFASTSSAYQRLKPDHEVHPSPATHAILASLKVGESVF